MKAIRMHEYGGADVLRYEDAPLPAFQPDEVLIRVAAASFNPIDAKIRQGLLMEHLPKTLPFVPGWDGAGVVEAVGQAVTHFAVGDEVFLMADFAHGGTYAEWVAVNEIQVALKPRTLSLLEAAALPMTALTALTALRVAELEAGQTILIHGGAGGVGTMAIQLAKARGAQVITTASGAGLALVQSLGAEVVIDYRTTAFQDVVREVDVVLDLLGGQTQEDSWGVLKRGGCLIATAQPPAPEKAEHYGVRATFIFTQPNGAALAEIAALVDAGKLRPIISRTLPLAEARQAHEGKGWQGKTVLVVA
jgi:NADPH:quinone reductase-like Zn-dependent oxidoreductase